ncbi:T9SS type A sorting domain-containing protein [Aureispira anguillae]|uniref:T9SS type A sorting domain-containing protein n=1 Tax=Aureispira anguillae TaxID=2864201 RepID=A0A915YDQ6_9BACT|nr:T9SS type A sorting domain-containing protein [Aureispira anguillae]BDS11225.1 T9SS type A sorting domain-containing protein [Aureispira anguillae]
MTGLNQLSYWILFIVLFFNYQAQATIQHTDITDVVVTGSTTAAIDFNGDGTAEFSLEDGSFGGNAEVQTFFDPAKVNFITQTATWDAFDPISLGTRIDASSGYNAQGDCYFNPFWASTVFTVGTDRYIGVKFDLGGNVHYGWVRVHLATTGVVTVKDYAYEDNAGVGIDAGITSSAILVTGINVQGQSGTSTLSVGNSLQMEAIVLPANANNSNVTWAVTNLTGTASIDSTTGILTGLSQGTVRVIASAQDASGISGNTTITINQTTALNQVEIETVQCYPNPAQKYFYINSQEEGSYQLLGIHGQEVLTNTINKGVNKIEVSLPQGLYLIRIISKKGEQTQRILLK